MSLLFLLWAFVFVGIKWGWLAGVGLFIAWLVIPPSSKIDSFLGLIMAYLAGLAIEFFGAYATSLVLGNIWGAVVAILIGVNAIVVWNKKR
jgi:hypothetical protein